MAREVITAPAPAKPGYWFVRVGPRIYLVKVEEFARIIAEGSVKLHTVLLAPYKFLPFGITVWLASEQSYAWLARRLAKLMEEKEEVGDTYAEESGGRGGDT